MGDGVEGLGAMAKGNGRREDDQERGRHKEMPRRYGVVDMGDEGGWL
jgi:hypothetical protein